MLKYDVLCVGSATVDNFLTIEEPLSKIKLGDKVIVTKIEKHSGGGATNAAAALAKLGLKVKVLTKLGRDHDAEFVNKELRDYKIKNICLHHSKKNTDNATIISSLKERDRIIYVHKGASKDLTAEDFKRSKLNTRWIYLGSLMGSSFSVANKLAEIVKENKRIKLLFNPSLYLAAKGKDYLKKVLSVSEIIILNKEEAQALLKTSSEDFPALLKGLQKLGPKTIIITDGKRKLYAYQDDTLYFLTPPDVKIVHTAGAGDAFNAGFLAGIIKRYPLADALCLGQANSSSVIQHLGTKNKLLTEVEAKRMMKRYQIKVTKKIFKNRFEKNVSRY
ncbi:MAG: carbohydrate kinase family protein [Nanoarchaeota archaeon]|nr:carbohydrate kinase family protein [Nanoarchaeota archaeon]MBU1644258.1 carbohydrate kinase family protein [Nanoarchaeota archaeon]MBU1977000.1 carbohydrate kinase family protein [Nanoarchaeota archaeon]